MTLKLGQQAAFAAPQLYRLAGLIPRVLSGSAVKIP
jgi:hypothetical protein